MLLWEVSKLYNKLFEILKWNAVGNSGINLKISTNFRTKVAGTLKECFSRCGRTIRRTIEEVLQLRNRAALPRGLSLALAAEASRGRSLCKSVRETGSASGRPRTRRSLPGGSGHCKGAKIKHNALWQIHGHKVVTVWIKSRKASGQNGNGVITRGLEGAGWILLLGMGRGVESCWQQCNKIQSRISHSLIFLPNWHVPLRNDEFFLFNNSSDLHAALKISIVVTEI